jgi:5'-3' exonuclease
MNSESNSFVLVDISYFKKYAANAAWRRYKSDNHLTEDDPTFDPMTDRAYEDALSGYFNCQLSEIIQRHYPFHDRSHTIFCRDCNRNEIWRKDIFTGYKFKRDAIKERFSFSSINEWVDEWMSKFTSIVGGHIIKVDHAEADDVIAVLSRRLLNLDDVNVLIVSGDSDLLQLTNDKVFQVDCYGEELTIAKKLEKEGVEFEPTVANYVKFKILTGDSSDNIPSVKHGKCGPKTAAKLISESGSIEEFVKSDKMVEEAFRRNYQLISLYSIPEAVVNAIDKEIDVILR